MILHTLLLCLLLWPCITQAMPPCDWPQALAELRKQGTISQEHEQLIVSEVAQRLGGLCGPTCIVHYTDLLAIAAGSTPTGSKVARIESLTKDLSDETWDVPTQGLLLPHVAKGLEHDLRQSGRHEPLRIVSVVEMNAESLPSSSVIRPSRMTGDLIFGEVPSPAILLLEMRMRNGFEHRTLRKHFVDAVPIRRVSEDLYEVSILDPENSERKIDTLLIGDAELKSMQVVLNKEYLEATEGLHLLNHISLEVVGSVQAEISHGQP